MLQLFQRSLIKDILKLETPIFLINPFFTRSSITPQVSIWGILSSTIQGLGELGSCIHWGGYLTLGSTYFKLIGKWIRYKSKYSKPKSVRVFLNAFYTCYGRWKVFQSLEVTKSYFLVIMP